MRIYIIANDGIMLCRKAPATVNDGEIAVGSNEELHAAPLSAKRLLALWNALPGVEKRRRVGDRDALIDQLWSAIELLPDPEPLPDPKRPSKQDVVIDLSDGRATKAGQPAASSGGYSINPKGQPHSAMIAEESTSLVIYSGEPNEVTSVEVIDIEPVPGE